jgi:hypothetical protein
MRAFIVDFPHLHRWARCGGASPQCALLRRHDAPLDFWPPMALPIAEARRRRGLLQNPPQRAL